MKYLLSAICLFITFSMPGQGCSDAGFCTINALKPGSHNADSEFKNHIRAGVSVGKADFDINIFSSFMEFGRQLNERLYFDMKITQLSQSGNDISKSGLSDFYLNSVYKVRDHLAFSAGVKVPFNSGDRIENLRPLPMDYQSSLGTFDLIIGASAAFAGIKVNVALQQPLNHNNNAFNPALYPSGSPLREFPNTNRFKRSGDILLRVAYPVSITEKLKLTPGLLPIFHIANDKFTDTDGVEKEIAGSQGLTLNTNVFVDYSLSSKNFLQLGLGMPLVVRDTRPDGLTRSFVASLEFSHRF